MFFRLLMESFVRQRRRKLLAGIAILLGTTAVTAMLALATTIGDRIHKELAVYGANIIVYPASDLLDVKIGGVDVKPATGGSYLKESDLTKLKTIFWANNITGVSPELPIQLSVIDDHAGEHQIQAMGLWFDHAFGITSGHTGAPQLHPSWKLVGAWPNPSTDIYPRQVVLGAQLAESLGAKTGSNLLIAMPGTTGHARTNEGPMLVVSGIADTGSPLDNQLLMPMADAQHFANLPNAITRVEISARTK